VISLNAVEDERATTRNQARHVAKKSNQPKNASAATDRVEKCDSFIALIRKNLPGACRSFGGHSVSSAIGSWLMPARAWVVLVSVAAAFSAEFVFWNESRHADPRLHVLHEHPASDLSPAKIAGRQAKHSP